MKNVLVGDEVLRRAAVADDDQPLWSIETQRVLATAAVAQRARDLGDDVPCEATRRHRHPAVALRASRPKCLQGGRVHAQAHPGDALTKEMLTRVTPDLVGVPARRRIEKLKNDGSTGSILLALRTSNQHACRVRDLSRGDLGLPVRAGGVGVRRAADQVLPLAESRRPHGRIPTQDRHGVRQRDLGHVVDRGRGRRPCDGKNGHERSQHGSPPRSEASHWPVLSVVKNHRFAPSQP